MLRSETAWEGERVYVFGTVRFNPGRRLFEMWYVGLPSRGELRSETAQVQVAVLDTVSIRARPEGRAMPKCGPG